MFLLTIFLPTRVLFIHVEGNSTVEERRILEAAQECGIRFGASRRQVRSEKMKNRLLEKVPELKWAGVNTSGCTAVISVREQPVQEQRTGYTGISSIVAACDGRITSCTVTKGNGLCAPGQVVQKGQLLISGYLDCGICIRVTGAEGEIFAETRQEK
jgi:sporulation protein YqfD